MNNPSKSVCKRFRYCCRRQSGALTCTIGAIAGALRQICTQSLKLPSLVIHFRPPCEPLYIGTQTRWQSSITCRTR